VEAIFKPFEQVGDRTRQSEGTGLGLSISSRIFNLMGSQIKVTSELEVGSNFFFEVDLPIAKDWVKDNMTNSGQNIIGYQGEKRRILVVDDRWENRSVLVNLLEPLGFELFEAENGQEGLEKALELQPDIIITDLAMPVMNGFEMLYKLRNTENIKHFKVIVSSASVSDIDKQKSLDSGGNDFLAKPVQVDELTKLLETHLQLRNLTKNLEYQVRQRTTELTQALQELQSSQMQLIQSEKMSALGNLFAGIAHEINNPVGFVHGNINHVEGYIKDLLELIDLYQKNYPQPKYDIQEKIEDIDLDYLREDLPKLINSTQEGVKRIRNISTSLRTFSRADSDSPTAFDIHQGLESTILILKHRLKADENRPAIEVINNYGSIPQVECYAGQINQVFMNIIANAIDALEESNKGRSFEEIAAKPNLITIKTEVSNYSEFITISIKDNGIGMSEETQKKSFEHLFTTKGVGKGTGLGLAIAHQIIVEKHHGNIQVNSTLGKGTEFTITIPTKANPTPVL
jgi:signal transduction histidine kinase